VAASASSRTSAITSTGKKEKGTVSSVGIMILYEWVIG
jgi:hypothetical protein